MIDIDSNIFLALPIEFLDIVYIYPPLVKDIIQKSHFQTYKQILTTSQEDIWDSIIEKEDKEKAMINSGEIPKNAPTPFDFLLINLFYDGEVKKLVEEAFLFFTHETIEILIKEKMIVFTTNLAEIKDVNDIRFLSNDNFFDFQNIIRAVCGDETIEPPTASQNPKIARIKAKARLRDRIKRKQKKKDGISFKTMLSALCCMGLGLNPLNIGEISYASAVELMRMWQEKDRHDSEIQFLAGGADSKKVKAKPWIK